MSIEQQRRLARLLAYDFPDDARAGISEHRADNGNGFTPQDVIIAVGEALGPTYEEIIGPSRLSRLSRPRQISAAILHSPWFGLSLEEIAAAMHRKDHTTVRHHILNNEYDGTFWDVAAEVANKAGIDYDEARKRIGGAGGRRASD